ncbi:unnamed protein product [Brassica napus]|uniref:(rape) hypothetical protein n=1 Tax=Brassica napus TaxID=3708 RepID=A0A816X2N1_BRANA|nr:unnamed protein product [Brassica napus]
MNWCSYLLIVRRRHGDVCASSDHLSISNQTLRSTGKTPTETFLNDVDLDLGRAELRFWLIDLFGFFWEARNTTKGHFNWFIAPVVCCFEDNDIYHVGGKINPTSDLDFINLELIFCDLDQVTLTYSFPFSNLSKYSFVKADLLHLLTKNTDL